MIITIFRVWNIDFQALTYLMQLHSIECSHLNQNITNLVSLRREKRSSNGFENDLKILLSGFRVFNF